jgi:hypothetical protein
MGRICEWVGGKRCRLDQLFMYGGLEGGGEVRSTALIPTLAASDPSASDRSSETPLLSIEICSLTARDSVLAHAFVSIPHKAITTVCIISYISFPYLSACWVIGVWPTTVYTFDLSPPYPLPLTSSHILPHVRMFLVNFIQHKLIKTDSRLC